MKHIDGLIELLKQAKEEVNETVNVSSTVSTPNQVDVSSTEKSEAVSADDQARPNRGNSVFTMEHVKEVLSAPSHADARQKAHSILKTSTANSKNKANIASMIERSRSREDLARGMSNHILAHPSENLKVVK